YDVGAQALERARRTDDHGPVPEPALRCRVAPPGGAALGEDRALARAQAQVRRRLTFGARRSASLRLRRGCPDAPRSRFAEPAPRRSRAARAASAPSTRSARR